MAQHETEVKLPASENFHLFLLAGQSNMAGRGEVTPGRNAPNPRVSMLTKDGAWAPATDPIHYDKPFAGVGLARTFAEAYLADHPGVTIGLIPAACGGSPISTWQPGIYFDQTDSHPWDDAVARTRSALRDGELQAILWHQGESDSNDELAPLYEANLEDLLQRFWRVFGDRELPVVIGQLGQFSANPWGAGTKQVDAAMQSVVAKHDNVGFVRSDGLEAKPDGIHFNAEALREFGKRYYTALAALE